MSPDYVIITMTTVSVLGGFVRHWENVTFPDRGSNDTLELRSELLQSLVRASTCTGAAALQAALSTLLSTYPTCQGFAERVIE